MPPRRVRRHGTAGAAATVAYIAGVLQERPA
ncbi:hypothetical protein J2Z30_004767 [Streptomyces iranensis]|uniref:Uncharacterized protein n=1 Tax=Streptomyces iranensis TaxID=576784 RepID=A0ABS4MVI3_9ACTN|nr:hypothetical protein [Streptomyces iranensis]